MSTPAAGLLRLARSKAGITQAELGHRAGVPASMISAYERDRRQPTLATLLRLLKAAGYELGMHLVPYDDHDDVLAEERERWPEEQREAWEAGQRAKIDRGKPVIEHSVGVEREPALDDGVRSCADR